MFPTANAAPQKIAIRMPSASTLPTPPGNGVFLPKNSASNRNDPDGKSLQIAPRVEKTWAVAAGGFNHGEYTQSFELVASPATLDFRPGAETFMGFQ